MKISKKDLKNIEIEVCETGFTVWVTERVKVGNKMRVLRHWIVDGSCIKDDGTIRLGETTNWKINAEYNAEDSTIQVTRR